MTFKEFRTTMLACSEAEQVVKDCVTEARDQLARLSRAYAVKASVCLEAARFEGLTASTQDELRRASIIARNTAELLTALLEEDANG